jgi:hypothetical protein
VEEALLVVVELCEPGAGRTGGVQVKPSRSIAAFDIFGVGMGSVTDEGIGRARNVYEPPESCNLFAAGDSVFVDPNEPTADRDGESVVIKIKT